MLDTFCRIQSCTPQSADCERCIKVNNELKTNYRQSLSLETENKYMFVYYNMPPLINWNPRKSILSWLNEKDRRIHENLVQKGTAIKQPWYKGIFPNTLEEEHELGENYLLEVKRNNINF